MDDHASGQARASSPSYLADNDEVSLFDLLDILKSGWNWIAGAAVAGAVGGLAFAVLAPDKFAATANIQVAMIAKEPVEMPATLAEKLKMPLYFSPASIAECGLTDAANPGEQLAKMIKPTVNRNAPLVNIRYEGRTAGDAKRCVSAILQHIQQQQAKLAEPVIGMKTAQLNALKQRLHEAEQFETAFGEKTSRLNTSSDKSNDSALLLAAMASNDRTIKELITEIGALELALSEPQTQKTDLATPVYTQEALPLTKRGLIAVAFTLAGIFAGIGLVAVRHAWTKSKNERRSLEGGAVNFVPKGQPVPSGRERFHTSAERHTETTISGG